jgi:hypothetical protein
VCEPGGVGHRAWLQDGVHQAARPSSQPSAAMLKLLKTQDIGYVTAKAQSEKNKIARLRATLHETGVRHPGTHQVFEDGEAPEAAVESEESDQEQPIAPRAAKRRREEEGEPASVAEEEDDEGSVLVSALNAAAAMADLARGLREEEMGEEAENAVSEAVPRAPVTALLDAVAAEEERGRDPEAERATRSRAAKRMKAAYEELSERESRARVLQLAAEHFRYQRELLGKGRRVKVSDASGDRPALFKWKKQRKR